MMSCWLLFYYFSPDSKTTAKLKNMTTANILLSSLVGRDFILLEGLCGAWGGGPFQIFVISNRKSYLLHEKHPRRQIAYSGKKMRGNHTQKTHCFLGGNWVKQSMTHLDQLCLVLWPKLHIWVIVLSCHDDLSCFEQTSQPLPQTRTGLTWAAKVTRKRRISQNHSNWHRSKASWFQAVF